MLSEPNNDWTHLADGRVRKQSAKVMEKQRQETEVAADTMSPAMVVCDSLFRQAMSLISKTECSVGERGRDGNSTSAIPSFSSA